MKPTLFIRNFFIFSLLLFVCLVSLGIYFLQANKGLENADNWVGHTQNIIIETQGLQLAVNRMLSNQRGYLLTGAPDYVTRYNDGKKLAADQIAMLLKLSRDNPEQIGRLNNLQHAILKLGDHLDETFQTRPVIQNSKLLADTQLLNDLRDVIIDQSQALLKQEYALLNQRAAALEGKTKNYRMTLLIGGVGSGLLLLLLNGFLLRAQYGRSSAERSLKETEDRLALAIRGSNDGVFDWDLTTEKFYWSPQYKTMLGYADHELPASVKVFKDLLHPEDAASFWQIYDQYISGNLSEFSHIFRMQHKAGRWIWIHARGKGLFDESGRATRFIGTHTDITHIKDYERRLEQEKDRAEKASVAKSDFLAHMSHEIRTPLTAISGIAEILTGMHAAFNEKQQKLIETLYSSSTSLKDLIADILDFSKIESGEIEMNDRQFALAGLFEQVISIMRVKASEKQLQYTFDYKGLEEEHFYGDQGRLRQILINLIGNAIKFTDKGRVTVRAEKEIINRMPVLKISVEDTGIGIGEDAMGIIFDKFRQADASVSRRYGGTGLGLPISKRLAEIMGGAIKVDSRPGLGSTFTLYLPFREIGQANAAVPAVAQNKQQDRLKNILEDKKKVLIVEDYEGNVVVLSHLLDDMGLIYDVARTGVEAIQCWKENDYGVILMDVQMPEMDGLTATQNIRTLEKSQSLEPTPIIGLTAHALVADREKCISVGMNHYLPKPIDEAELRKLIAQHLRKQPGKKSQAA